MDYRNKILNPEDVPFLNQGFATEYQKKFVENHVEITQKPLPENALTPNDKYLKGLNEILAKEIENHKEWSNYINTAKCSTSQRQDALNQKNRKESKLFNDINDYMIKVIENYEVKKDLLNQNDKKYLHANLEIIKSYWEVIKNERNNIRSWDNYINNSHVSSIRKNPYILKKNAAEEKFYDDMNGFLSKVDTYVNEFIKRTIPKSQNTSKKYCFER